MEAKSWVKSKTMLLNLLLIAAAVIQGLFDVVANVDENATITAGIIAAVNAGLRVVTKQPVKL